MPTSRPVLLSRAPADAQVTAYDRAHRATYMRLFDAAESGADWRDAAATILALDPDAPDSRAIWESHLARARWMVAEGWKQLIEKQR